MKLNKNKCQFCREPSKIDAITKLPVLQSLTELQTFLGMVNYLGKFIPNFAEVTAPLRTLLTKGVVFNSQKPQLNTVEKLKSLITSDLILKIFDPNLPLRLKIDVSSGVLEALLKQSHVSLKIPKWHPVRYVS